MTKTKALTIPKSEDVRSEAIETIIERLGITKAAFFIRETMPQKVDYLKVKEKLFGTKTASELYGEIKKSKP
jgi:hypothetical protein